MGPAAKMPSFIHDAMGSSASFLAVDTSTVVEKYRIQTLWLQGVLVLAFLAVLAIAVYSEFHSAAMAAVRVLPAALVALFTCCLVWRDGASRRAGPFMVYGFAVVLIMNQAIVTPSMAGMFLNFSPLCILAILILGFRIGIVLATGVFSILLLVYLLSINSSVMPILFTEPDIAYFSGPVFTLFLVVQVGRLLRELASEGMLSHQLLSQYVENHRHLFSVMTHDLSNVLFLGILSWESGARKRFVQSIDELGQLSEAVKQIHEGVAAQAPARTRVPLKDVIKTAQFVFAVHLRSKGLKVVVDYGDAENAFLSTSSPILTHVILNNIVSNAIKFSPPDSSIVISASASGDRVIVEVIDQGEGIPDETARAISDGRAVLSRPGTRGELGTGFGLRNAREMARRLDIEMELQKGVPRGTVARLIVPAAT